MRKLLIAILVPGILFACKNKTESSASNEPMVKSTAAEKTKGAEFADEKYMQMGKERLQEFESGDIEKWVGQFADNAVYIWSAGDSLAGKKAIMDYWMNRRKNVIQSIKMSNDIWLPIKVNQPQKGPDMPGVWLLGWYQVNVTYKNGKSLQFWVHNDLHYNDKDQVDRAVQYIDRAPINAALNTK
jgi:hypothetical protein